MMFHSNNLSRSSFEIKFPFVIFILLLNYSIRFKFRFAYQPPAQALRVTPLLTSHNRKLVTLSSYFYQPTSTMPNPPLITYPQPTPPPLWRATHVAPRIAPPTKFCTAMSAVNIDPSQIEDVYRYGESVPETS